MTLRPYQKDAVDAAIAYAKKSTMPQVLELATGAGKSHIVAAIAGWVWRERGKRVLCIQPSKELTEQNYAKYLATGGNASLFSASAGQKCLRHPVVYGTPGTVKNSLDRFGAEFGAVIIDEAHGTTPTIKAICANIKKANQNARIVGMTATPYRLGEGYIYAYDLDGVKANEDDAKPYYHQLTYSITTRELIDMGFLTDVAVACGREDSYDTDGLKLNKMGQFEQSEVGKVFEGHGRLTSRIVADVVARAADRRGVMLFAATVPHAAEILASLPPSEAVMLGGDVNMAPAKRAEVINGFKSGRYKYIVSVGTLTTGFDAPHVDLIAVLRKTESPGLFQQIIGRGLRLSAGKSDCLLLDYAGNINFHKLDDDIFTPEVALSKRSSGGDIAVICPQCGGANRFRARENKEHLEVDANGYFLAPGMDGTRLSKIVSRNGDGEPIYKLIPAHYGRKCHGTMPVGRGLWGECTYRWEGKDCGHCGHENDIAARRCEKCNGELVDPNDKLSSAPNEKAAGIFPVVSWQWSADESDYDCHVECKYYCASGWDDDTEPSVIRDRFFLSHPSRAAIDISIDKLKRTMRASGAGSDSIIRGVWDKGSPREIARAVVAIMSNVPPPKAVETKLGVSKKTGRKFINVKREIWEKANDESKTTV